VGISVEWKGKKGTVNEIGIDKHNPSHVLVKVDPDYFRPTEVRVVVVVVVVVVLVVVVVVVVGGKRG